MDNEYNNKFNIMKKTALFFSFILAASMIFAQYDGNKLPSGLTLSTAISDDDYTIIQINGETYVKAIRMDTIQSYMTEGMASEVIVLDTLSGETGQFIISNGTGWLTPISALYEGDNAYSFGQRAGSIGNWSFITGFENEASGYYSSALGGKDNTTSGFYSSVLGGRSNTASGIYSSVLGGSYSIASGDYSSVLGGTQNTASGFCSSALGGNNNTASGYSSSAIGSLNNTASGYYSSALGGTYSIASGDYSSILTSEKSSASGDHTTIIGGISDTITTDNNIILNSNSCSIGTDEYNLISNSQTVSVSGESNFVNNCTNSEFVADLSFISHSLYSQYKGAGYGNFVFACQEDTLDLDLSDIKFCSVNKGIISGSSVMALSGQTWTDSIIDSYLFDAYFYNDTLTRAEALTAINSGNIGIKYGVKNMFTTNSDGTYFSNDEQSVFGSWNDSTPTTSDRLLQVGNGSAAGSRADALCSYESGALLVGGGIAIGDTASVETISTTPITGMIANDVNGDLMQWDGTQWNRFRSIVQELVFNAYVPEDSTQTTTTTNAATWYFIGYGTNSKFVNTVIEGFSFDGDTLQYIGTDTLYFDYIGTFSRSGDANNITTGIAVAINDVIEDQTIQCGKMQVSGDCYHLSNHGLIELAPNDKIKFMLKSDDAGAVITTVNFCVTISRQ